MEKSIIVGKILAAHGIKGQVKVEVLSDNPKRFLAGSRLYAPKAQTHLTVAEAQAYRSGLLLRFAEIADRNGAENLASSYLTVAAADLPELAVDTYYHFQLVGLSVWEKHTLLGEIAAVESRGGTDYYVVKKTNGGEFMIPALKHMIRKIDVAAGRMEVGLPQGLLD